jgi:hypothetical protein
MLFMRVWHSSLLEASVAHWKPADVSGGTVGPGMAADQVCSALTAVAGLRNSVG